MLLDRDEVFRAKLGGREDLALVDHGGAPARAEIMKRFAAIPLHVTAGVHEIVVTFVERARAATDEAIFGFTPYGGFSYQGQMRVPRLDRRRRAQGPVLADRRVAYGEPRQDLRLHARGRERGARVRGEDRRDARAARVPPARSARTTSRG